MSNQKTYYNFFHNQLNDVEKGGFTPFPILGTFVKPVKASAVLWYNSLKNGSIDSRMVHGACKCALYVEKKKKRFKNFLH